MSEILMLIKGERKIRLKLEKFSGFPVDQESFLEHWKFQNKQGTTKWQVQQRSGMKAFGIPITFRKSNLELITLYLHKIRVEFKLSACGLKHYTYPTRGHILYYFSELNC
jgi:hypothetical protein